jgi:hypothetical protein
MFEKLVEISQTEVHVSDYCEVCGGFIEWDKSVQLLSYLRNTEDIVSHVVP